MWEALPGRSMVRNININQCSYLIKRLDGFPTLCWITRRTQLRYVSDHFNTNYLLLFMMTVFKMSI